MPDKRAGKRGSSRATAAKPPAASARSRTTAAEPVTTAAEPVTTAAEPVTTVAESAMGEPATAAARSGPANVVTPKTEPAQPKDAQPGTKAAQPKAKAAQPKAKAAQPGTKDVPESAPDARLAVRKTYKLFVGGAFPRSESGRTYQVRAAGDAVVNVARASRKDARDAVVAARAAVAKWSGATAYNRGQVLYRVAEMLDGRAAQFAAEVAAAEQVTSRQAGAIVDAAIDRWIWYAGWPDKVAQVAGGANPVAGPYFNFSVPEPTGVVAVLAPAESSLLGLVSVVAPVIATGNAAVVVASQDRPLPAITLAEVLATSDVPGGVVNVLTGFTTELAPVLAGHMDVNAIDTTGADAADRPGLERLAAASVKRVFAAGEDWTAPPVPRRMLAFLETKTVWHPMGS